MVAISLCATPIALADDPIPAPSPTPVAATSTPTPSLSAAPAAQPAATTSPSAGETISGVLTEAQTEAAVPKQLCRMAVDLSR